MTLTVDDDFAGFVAARWPELEALALVATLEPRAARELVTQALATLHSRWDEAVEEGTPTAAARTRVLTRVAALPVPPGAVAVSWFTDAAADTDDAVPAALLAALEREVPIVRAALTAGPLWKVSEPELDRLLGRGAGETIAAARDARRRLVGVHREARAAQGLSPADHHLDDDLADLLDRLTAAQSEPPDPAALVSQRAAGLRRRHLLRGGGAVALVAAGATWVVRTTDATAGPRPGPSAAPPRPGPRDPAWSSTSTWAPRGPLARDIGIQALVVRAGGAGARLVYAADLPRLRAVVAVVPQTDDLMGGGSAMKVWTGPVGTPAEQLGELPLALEGIYGVPDVLAVGLAASALPATTTELDADPTATLLVLARPTARSADFSPVVTLTAAGAVQRTVTRIGLVDGVATLPLDRPYGAGAFIRCSGYSGTIPSPQSWLTDAFYDDDPVATLVQQVASVTGLPRGRLVARLLVDSPTDGSVLDASAISPQGADGRVRMAILRTPERAIVRTLVVSDDGRGRSGVLFDQPRVVPAELAEDPVIMRLNDIPPRTGRFLVVVPAGGVTCQLLATSPNAYPVSKVTRMKGRSAVVLVINADDAGGFRLVVKDAAGRTTYDAVPPVGNDLFSRETETPGDTIVRAATSWVGRSSDEVP